MSAAYDRPVSQTNWLQTGVPARLPRHTGQYFFMDYPELHNYGPPTLDRDTPREIGWSGGEIKSDKVNGRTVKVSAGKERERMVEKNIQRKEKK